MRAAPGSASETVGFSSVGEPSVLRVGLSASGVGSSRHPSTSTCRSRSFVELALDDLAVLLRAADDVARLRRVSLLLPFRLRCRRRCARVVAAADVPGVGVGVRVRRRGVRWASASASASRPARGRRSASTGAGSGGSWMSLTEVPAGTSTVSSTVSPVVSVTASRCSSAEAGTTTAAYSAAAASAMSNVRRLMIGCENPPSQYRRDVPPMRRSPRACGVAAPYWVIVACAICATDKGASRFRPAWNTSARRSMRPSRIDGPRPRLEARSGPATRLRYVAPSSGTR